jgi:hypothetical protein
MEERFERLRGECQGRLSQTDSAVHLLTNITTLISRRAENGLGSLGAPGSSSPSRRKPLGFVEVRHGA